MIPGALNRLKHEKSPYLLQHAENPVDWYPWGEEAFARAKREDKPVFLSIGYSTCHWCHVMAHESFEDEETASLLNEAFVCVKVDREERPDIDGIYMRVCQMMTGGGGWPLTVVMTPERRPFFAATYIPKGNRWGKTGLIELIPQIGRLWRTERERIEEAAAKTVSVLRQPVSEQGETPGAETLSEAFAELQGQFDEEFGGFGAAPKFPMPHQLLFLLRHGERTGGEEAIRMAGKTLRTMRRGGIFDQLGYGFHRYSTDRQWLVPHFEKMLYDQALCALAATEAFQAGSDSSDREHTRTAREVLEYVLRDLHAPEGGFYAAEDADSEGEEGRFYLWGMDEIRRLLDPEEACFAVEIFGLEEGGNFTDPVTGKRMGLNILHLADSEEEAAEGYGISGEELRRRLDNVRRKLLAARAGRVRPRRDEKILADWNGLMIAALARAACVLEEPRYLAAARVAADFVRTRMQTPDGRLLHRWCGGEPAVTGNLDDYAFMVWGAIELYEAGFAAGDLRTALELQRILTDRFRDPEGGFFFTPDDGEELLVRLKESHDGAVPSGNAVTLMNLIHLGRMTGDPRLEEEAAALCRAFAESVRRFPSAHAQWLVALEMLAAPSCEVVVTGRREALDTREMIEVVRRCRSPRPVLLLRPAGETAPEIAELAPFTREMGAIGGRAAAYVCQNFSCRRPVTDPQELAAILAAEGKR
ncbi:MAG: thioredoxin domain-containing protein [Deltaproteobacteria bacterium]|nr:thioredoxin domain-containing protein [Deltaproteobacteria bacterium]